MHASTLFSKPARLDAWCSAWLTVALCTAACLGDIALYLTASSMPIALVLLNLIAFASLWRDRRRANRLVSLQPQDLARQMLDVQQAERHRLSRELHDDIGQMLTSARLQSEWLQRRMPPALHARGERLNDILQKTLNKVRDLSTILNPRQLASHALEASLREHLLASLTDTQVHWSLECRQSLTGIPEEMGIAVFRITQEAVTNMLRHAQAHNLLVRIRRLPAGLALSISDDGAGFEPASAAPRLGQHGIAGMAERVSLLGGAWTMRSSLGQGTHIEALLPWPARDNERASLHKKAP